MHWIYPPAPYIVAALCTMLAGIGITYRIGETNDARRGRTPEERRLNRIHRLISSAAFLAYLGLLAYHWWLIGKAPRQAMMMQLSPLLMLALPAMQAGEKRFRNRALRVSQYPIPDDRQVETETQCLNQRISEIARKVGGQTSVAEIPSDLNAVRYATVGSMGERTLVSRLMMDTASREELDYLLARELIPLNGICANWVYIIIVLFVAVAALAMEMMMSGFSRSLAIPLVLLLALIVSILWYFERLTEGTKDILALQATGDLAVAESAIVKSMKYGRLAIAVGDPAKDHRVQRRLAELRDRASRVVPGEQEA